MGAGGSQGDIHATNGAYKPRKLPECNKNLVPKNKLPHEVLDGFTSYMKNEIEKAQDKQKRNRQGSARPVELKSSNSVVKQEVKTDIKPSLNQETVETKSHENKAEAVVLEENKKPIEEVVQKVHKPAKLEHIEMPVHQEENKEASLKEGSEFRVESMERELEVLRNPESPRPAPPVFDDNFEADLMITKEERLAKEREALEHAQKVAYEQKLKEQQEIGENKNALNQLENKFDNIASKYLKGE